MSARFLFTVLAAIPAAFAADDWPQFRGPNAAGVSSNTGLPVEFGPDKNVVWKTPLPPGHSSPILAGDSIFLTAVDNTRLFVISLDRATGRIKWRHEVPRPRNEELHKSNSAASPSVVSDGKNAYAFFTDFGLMAFGPDGNELWRIPMGPFNNPMGMGASPVLTGNKLLMICDQESGSYFLAVDKRTGKQIWRTDRTEFTRGFATPVLYQPKDGGDLQAIIAGSLQLMAYSVETGKPVWWTRGLTWQLKPTPVMSQDTIYVQCWAGGSDNGQQESIENFEDAVKRMDKNGDGKLSKEEIGDPKIVNDWRSFDLDNDGVLDLRDWQNYQGRRSAVNALIAIRLGGKGDVTDSAIKWRYYKSLPNVPSPLLYQDVLYMLKEGGILSTFDPVTGAVLKQGRLTGALGQYFASPVAADGKIYTVDQEGHATVLKAGGQWEILAVNDLKDESHSTPAIAGNRLYIRTHGMLYCFAAGSPANGR